MIKIVLTTSEHEILLNLVREHIKMIDDDEEWSELVDLFKAIEEGGKPARTQRPRSLR
jgi:hypothetical protein